jgi:magnesium-transporting ATPase (P-type)
MIFSIALCHTVIIEKNGEKIQYNASSPDELALINAAKYFGVELYERTEDNDVLLRFKGINFKFHLLHVLEFSSERKRMSVLVRDENSKIKLICKGADSEILKRLDVFDE